MTKGFTMNPRRPCTGCALPMPLTSTAPSGRVLRQVIIKSQGFGAA
jgi:hypothetical protein